MGEKKYANDPVLFINQPNIARPKAEMQYEYVTPKRESAPMEKSIEQYQPKRKKITGKKAAPSIKAEGQDEEKERKLFKDMTIEEKIHYFLNTHTYSPKLRCEIKTTDRTYQGIISDYKDGRVYMQIGKRSSSTVIPLEKIKQVKMLGF